MAANFWDGLQHLAALDEIDRRSFLRRAMLATATAPALSLAGCGEGRAADEAAGAVTVPPLPPITRPILRPWPPDAVRISTNRPGR